MQRKVVDAFAKNKPKSVTSILAGLGAWQQQPGNETALFVRSEITHHVQVATCCREVRVHSSAHICIPGRTQNCLQKVANSLGLQGALQGSGDSVPSFASNWLCSIPSVNPLDRSIVDDLAAATCNALGLDKLFVLRDRHEAAEEFIQAEICQIAIMTLQVS